MRNYKQQVYMIQGATLRPNARMLYTRRLIRSCGKVHNRVSSRPMGGAFKLSPSQCSSSNLPRLRSHHPH